MRRSILIVICLGAVLLVTFPLQAADAAATYKTKCAMCHGPDGAGDTAMGKKLGLRPLGSADVQKQTDAELTAIVKAGKAKMPAYGGKIPDDDIAGLVKLIRTFKK